MPARAVRMAVVAENQPSPPPGSCNSSTFNACHHPPPPESDPNDFLSSLLPDHRYLLPQHSVCWFSTRAFTGEAGCLNTKITQWPAGVEIKGSLCSRAVGAATPWRGQSTHRLEGGGSSQTGNRNCRKSVPPNPSRVHLTATWGQKRFYCAQGK